MLILVTVQQDSGKVWADAEPAPHILLNAKALCCWPTSKHAILAMRHPMCRDLDGPNWCQTVGRCTMQGGFFRSLPVACSLIAFRKKCHDIVTIYWILKCGPETLCKLSPLIPIGNLKQAVTLTIIHKELEIQGYSFICCRAPGIRIWTQICLNQIIFFYHSCHSASPTSISLLRTWLFLRARALIKLTTSFLNKDSLHLLFYYFILSMQIRS